MAPKLTPPFLKEQGPREFMSGLSKINLSAFWQRT